MLRQLPLLTGNRLSIDGRDAMVLAFCRRAYKSVSTAELIPALSLALFFGLPQLCLVQVANRSVLQPSAQRAAVATTVVGSMVLVRGGTAEMGIDAAQIPSFVKTFNIDVPATRTLSLVSQTRLTRCQCPSWQ
jgi:hypothetical protein